RPRHHSGEERYGGSDPSCAVEPAFSAGGKLHGVELLRHALHPQHRRFITRRARYSFLDLHRQCCYGEALPARERGSAALAGGAVCVRWRFSAGEVAIDGTNGMVWFVGGG